MSVFVYIFGFVGFLCFDSFCLTFQYSAWSTPESYNQTELALDVGMTTITYYEEFFGIAFPLPKQGVNLKKKIYMYERESERDRERSSMRKRCKLYFSEN